MTLTGAITYWLGSFLGMIQFDAAVNPRFVVDMQPMLIRRFVAAKQYLEDPENQLAGLRELDSLIRTEQERFLFNPRGIRVSAGFEALSRVRALDNPKLIEKFEGSRSIKESEETRALLDKVAAGPHLKSGWDAAVILGRREMQEGRYIHATWAFNFALETSPFRRLGTRELVGNASLSYLRAGQDDRAFHSWMAFRRKETGFTLRDYVGDLSEPTIPISVKSHPRHLSELTLANLNRTMGEPAPFESAFTLVWRAPDPVLAERKDRQVYGVYSTRETNKWIQGAHEEDKDAAFYQLPVFEPRLIGARLFFRSPAGIHGADLNGAKLWVVKPPSSLESLLTDPETSRRPGKWQYDLFFTPKFHDNRVGAALSSDGEFVFAVVDGMKPKDASYRDTIERNGWLLKNSLVAIHQASGWETWRWDGMSCGKETPCPKDWDGAYFLSPPLIVEHELFVPIDLKGTLNLLCLERATGRLKWSRAIGKFRAPLRLEMQRRTQGVQLALDNGKLAIATNSGALVLFDLFLRQVRWVADYQTSLDGPKVQSNGQQPVWRYASDPVFADGKILIAAPDSRDVRCYDVEEGRLVWKREAKHDQFLAGVYQDRAILGGNYGMRALSLKDGSVVWYKQLGGAEGRGVFRGRKYLLPVRFGRLVEIDLKDGSETLLTRFDHSLGNITTIGKFLISQTEDAIHVYKSGLEVVTGR